MSESLQKPAEASLITAAKPNHSPYWRAQLTLWRRPELDSIKIHQESQT
ncbi:MAG TPA: hypothetical protein VLE70_19600 [Anaerolineae bacterium]|jgi:hypothetical protein|nr:hypothetical protein [Anaerolineae bacterium]